MNKSLLGICSGVIRNLNSELYKKHFEIYTDDITDFPYLTLSYNILNDIILIHYHSIDIIGVVNNLIIYDSSVYDNYDEESIKNKIQENLLFIKNNLYL
jgi:hypothetical protein